MNRIVLVLLALLFAPPLWGQSKLPIAGVDHVMIVSIDGLRPDIMLRADTPNLRSLMKRGSFTMWAYTIPVAITLPSHTSMLTGVTLEKHHIDFNDERGTTRPFHPDVPSIFDLAHQQGLTTALISGKEKFIIFQRNNAIDWLVLPRSSTIDDSFVTEHAVKVIQEHQPQVLFVHYPGADNVGHAKGWGTAIQIETVEAIDKGLGEVLKALDDAQLTQRTLIIVTADHGGSGRVHGEKVPDSINIPWIAAGPGVRENYDLTLISDMRINTYDTFATACWAMGIPIPPENDGKAIKQILPGQELMVSEPAGAANAPISRGVHGSGNDLPRN